MKDKAVEPAAAEPAAPAAPSQPAAGIDPALIETLGKVIQAYDLTEIEVQHGDLRIRLARKKHIEQAPARLAPAPAMPADYASATPAERQPEDHPGAVKSPMVGTAYRRPRPEAKAFVEVGSQVVAGEKILLVEAMKTFNEIVAPRAGVVTAIFVEDGQPIEFGQSLLVIE